MIIKLEYGTRTLDINDGVNYKVGVTFTPPTTVEDTNYSAGTSANRYGGSKLMGKRARDRQWDFDIIIMGISVSETHNLATDLANFLALASTGADTLYLLYQPHDAVSYEPVFGGMGGALRYEVKHGSLVFNDNYGVGRLRYQRLFATVQLDVGPYALGKRQALLTATGGIVDDFIGSTNGLSRGMIIPPATTNKITDPIMANWSTAWTTGAGLTSALNSDQNYVAYGFGDSVKLTAIAATNNTFTIQATAGNTNAHTLSIYAKLPDGGAISATQAVLYYYAADQTTTYTPVGNGWYRLTARIAVVYAGATTAGIKVTRGVVVYVTAEQLEELAYPTPFIYGGRPGCAWSGTAHASTTVRTAGKASVPVNKFPVALEQKGTIVLALKMNVGSTIHPNSTLLSLYGSGQAAVISYVASGTKFQANLSADCDSAAQTFAANAIYILHVVYDNTTGGAQLYVNAVAGTPAAISNTFDTAFTTLYLGSDNSGANQGVDTILGVALYKEAFTAAEVTSTYADIINQINSSTYGRQIGNLGYFWTQDGDNILDNGNDTNTPRHNYALVGGIPGSAPAVTDLQITTGGAPSTYGRLALSLSPISYGLFTQTVLFEDESGTTLASANGSAVLKTAVNTTAAAIASKNLIKSGMYIVNGQEYYVFARMYVATSTNKTYDITTSFKVGNSTITSDSVRKTLVSTARLYYYGPLVAPSTDTMQYPKIGLGNPVTTINLNANTTVTRSTATVDYMAVMPRPLMMIPTTTFAYTTGQLYISGRDVILWDGTSYRDTAAPIGDAIEFLPQVLNMLQQLMGDDSVANLVTWTATYTAWVTPRYALV